MKKNDFNVYVLTIFVQKVLKKMTNRFVCNVTTHDNMSKIAQSLAIIQCKPTVSHAHPYIRLRIFADFLSGLQFPVRS